MGPLIFAALSASSATTALTLPQILAEVSARSPALAVKDQEIRTARAAVKRAGAWEDPVASLMIEDIALRRHEPEPMEPMLTYRITQPLTLFGRRRAAKDSAAARAAQVEADRRRVELDARQQAAMAFYELWMNQEMDRLIGRQVEALEKMRESARAQYEAGMMMGHHDFLRAEAEIAAMSAERASLEEMRRAAQAMLDVLRGQAPRARPEVVELVRTPLPELERLLPRTDERPEVQAARAMRAEALAEREVAEKMYLPMVMAGAMFQQRLGSEPNSVGAEVALSLPVFWWDRQDNEVEMADAMIHRAEREIDLMQLMTLAELRAVYSQAQAADRTLGALEAAAIPKMRETVASSQAAYSAGTNNFLSLLDATLALLELEERRIGALADRELAVFGIERILGIARTEAQAK